MCRSCFVFAACVSGAHVGNDATLSPTPFFESLAALVGALAQIEANSYANALPTKPPHRGKRRSNNNSTDADTYTNSHFASYDPLNGMNEEDEEDSVDHIAVNETSWRVTRKEDLRGRLKKTLFKVVDILQVKLERFNNSRDSLANNSTTRMRDRSSGIGLGGGGGGCSSNVSKRPKLNNGNSFMDTDSEDDEDEYTQHYHNEDGLEEGEDEDGYVISRKKNGSRRTASSTPVSNKRGRRNNKSSRDEWRSKEFEKNQMSSEVNHFYEILFFDIIHISI